MMNISQSILATLAYHEIFDYPLTLYQIYNFLPKKVSKREFETELSKLTKSKRLKAKNELYYLKNRGGLITINYKRKLTSKKKLVKAIYYSKILSFIPMIKMVALTGALAMNNSEGEDDIDLLVVTAKKQLWQTRLAANLALLQYKRSPGKSKSKDKACLNIFISEDSLKIRTQNLYTAHEIAQTKPLWQRDNTYYKYIKANSWVKKYLPNWQAYPEDSITSYPQPKFHLPFTIHRKALLINYSLIEIFTKKFQLIYMKKKITSETIGDKQLFFHPSNTERNILERYKKRLGSLGIQ